MGAKILRLPAVAQDDNALVFPDPPEAVPSVRFSWIRFFNRYRRKNPTTSPGIMLSEMPIVKEIILPLRCSMCIMKMTDYAV